MTTHEPPNLRDTDSCFNFSYKRWDMENEIPRCQKHDGAVIGRGYICDDYEGEVMDEPNK